MKRGVVRIVDLDGTPAEVQTALEHTDAVFEFDIPDGAEENTIRLLAYGTLFEHHWTMQGTASEWWIKDDTRPQCMTCNKRIDGPVWGTVMCAECAKTR